MQLLFAVLQLLEPAIFGGMSAHGSTVSAVASARRLPDWFVQHRTHAHTRFAPEHYCSKNATTGNVSAKIVLTSMLNCHFS
eukprot:COSAG02_NODE_10707_length_1877_cov_2.213161_1_plen_81_part_00